MKRTGFKPITREKALRDIARLKPLRRVGARGNAANDATMPAKPRKPFSAKRSRARA